MDLSLSGLLNPEQQAALLGCVANSVSIVDGAGRRAEDTAIAWAASHAVRAACNGEPRTAFVSVHTEEPEAHAARLEDAVRRAAAHLPGSSVTVTPSGGRTVTVEVRAPGKPGACRVLLAGHVPGLGPLLMLNASRSLHYEQGGPNWSRNNDRYKAVLRHVRDGRTVLLHAGAPSRDHGFSPLMRHGLDAAAGTVHRETIWG